MEARKFFKSDKGKTSDSSILKDICFLLLFVSVPMYLNNFNF